MADREDAVGKWGGGCLKRHDFRGRGGGCGGWGGERFFRLLLASKKRLVVRAVYRGGAALGGLGVRRHEDYCVRD